MQQTIDLVAARGKQQKIEIQSELTEQPLLIEADHEQLRRLLNLILNAMDAQPDGGTIKISMSQSPNGPAVEPSPGQDRPQPAAWTTVTVADEGPGIAAGMIDRLFDPYVSSKETGLGLGLSICRRIVEDHGGEISVRNASTRGAVFTVRLPIYIQKS